MQASSRWPAVASFPCGSGTASATTSSTWPSATSTAATAATTPGQTGTPIARSASVFKCRDEASIALQLVTSLQTMLNSTEIKKLQMT